MRSDHSRCSFAVFPRVQTQKSFILNEILQILQILNIIMSKILLGMQQMLTLL